jgi:hypothetical protein
VEVALAARNPAMLVVPAMMVAVPIPFPRLDDAAGGERDETEQEAAFDYPHLEEASNICHGNSFTLFNFVDACAG